MSLEDEAQALIAAGREKGLAEHNEIRRNVEADEGDKPSSDYGYVEEIARWSDLAEFRGYVEGLRDAVLLLARAIDSERSKPE
jgi:hypothetical protein